MLSESDRAWLEECVELLNSPTYNSLEVGFKHAPLTKDEIIERQAETINLVKQQIEYLLKRKEL